MDVDDGTILEIEKDSARQMKEQSIFVFSSK
jgi:hypothetical protein